MAGVLAACGGDGAEPASSQAAETDADTVAAAETSATEPDDEPAGDRQASSTTAPQSTSMPGSTTAVVTPAEADDDAAAAIRAMFEAYRAALLAADGAAAADLVTPGTITWYGTLADIALDADADELLTGLPLSEAMSALSLRARLGDELLNVGDGRELFEIGVDRELVGSDLTSLQLDDLEIDGDVAFARVEGRRLLRFERGPQGWQMDLAYFTSEVLDANEAEFVAGLTGDPSAERRDLFELVALGLGTDWEDLSQPLR